MRILKQIIETLTESPVLPELLVGMDDLDVYFTTSREGTSSAIRMLGAKANVDRYRKLTQNNFPP